MSIYFGNAPGAVLPFLPLRFTDKMIKLRRPAATDYIIIPEGTHYSKLFFDAVSNAIVKVDILHEYPFTAEGVRQTQIDPPRGKSRAS